MIDIGLADLSELREKYPEDVRHSHICFAIFSQISPFVFAISLRSGHNKHINPQNAVKKGKRNNGKKMKRLLDCSRKRLLNP